jgi:CRP-like cAMP-binding protein
MVFILVRHGARLEPDVRCPAIDRAAHITAFEACDAVVSLITTIFCFRLQEAFMPSFVDSTVKDIDGRLRELRDELARLEAARTALTGGRRRPGRPRAAATRTTRARATRTRTARRTTAAPRKRAAARRGGNTRAAQTLTLVQQRPGITIPQIAEAMKIQPNYLYRVLPRLASEGQVRRDGQGWHPAS